MLEALIVASSRAPRELVGIVDVLVGDVLGAIVARERLTRVGESVEIERVFLNRGRRCAHR